MVQDLLDLKEKLDNVVKTCFNQDKKFVTGLQRAFESSVNKRQNKPAELIGLQQVFCLVAECLKCMKMAVCGFLCHREEKILCVGLRIYFKHGCATCHLFEILCGRVHVIYMVAVQAVCLLHADT